MNQIIKKTDLIGKVIAQNNNKVIPIFFKYGFHCVGCMLSNGESIEEGAIAHGFDEVKIDSFVKDLNDAINKD